ncbi:cofilin [Coemansia guatemalensis]|uniref:Cofilin n=1 Tax=Coemansia guatemalensis TaxID=2761395 RepID=A0A9W8LV63_9FUNG|nr:cofilin [Coemansia guatemalensis]
MPSLCRRASVSSAQLYDTSAYKYAIFDIDKLQKDIYAPSNVHTDDYTSFRSFLPAHRCCYAVYRLTFIYKLRPASAVIFYTWLPADASNEEKQLYMANSNNVADQLSHYDFRFECSEWKEFQHSAAVSRIIKLMKY